MKCALYDVITRYRYSIEYSRYITVYKTSMHYDAMAVKSDNGPLARYVKLRVVHAPGMPGMFSPPPLVSDPVMHHDTCVTHVLWCMPGSLTSGFLWLRWRGKHSRHSRRMRNPQFYVSGKRPMVATTAVRTKMVQIVSSATCVWVIFLPSCLYLPLRSTGF